VTSRQSQIIKPGIRIAIYQGARGNMDEGWTRYVFDTFNVPYESLRDIAMREGNLRARLDVIVLPSERARGSVEAGDSESSASGMSSAAIEALHQFVDDGGTLICFDTSCESAIKEFKLPLKNVLEGLRSSDFYCPGSILRINVDISHPIGRAMGKDVAAYFINSSAFEATDKDRVHVIARYAEENVLRSGWLLGEDKIKDRIALAEVSFGKGRIVLFGFRPQHRGQTWGTFPFIWNAINLAR
jgi:hypothetical protein